VQLVHTAKRSFRTLLPCAAAAHAQWLAYALPCRRFADTLADANARLGADAVRYSFIAVDFHHLLFAGLFRRTKNLDFSTTKLVPKRQMSFDRKSFSQKT
jgi:hypothetical protein